MGDERWFTKQCSGFLDRDCEATICYSYGGALSIYSRDRTLAERDFGVRLQSSLRAAELQSVGHLVRMQTEPVRIKISKGLAPLHVLG